MLAKLFSAFPHGLQATLVEIEVQVEPGLRSFQIIGLPDEAVREATNRVASAVKWSGFQAPQHMNKRITVNLAPADIKKQGACFDVAIALGFLVASGQLTLGKETMLVLGELSLDGRVRAVPGVLSIAQLAKQHGYQFLVLPQDNTPEAKLLEGITPVAVTTLAQLVAYLRKEIQAPALPELAFSFDAAPSDYDLADIKGQELAKRALEISAAGGHHLFMVGPPGAGKSILARSLPSLLGPLARQEGVEVATVLSSLKPLNTLTSNNALSLQRPFRFPHHSASAQAILGGGVMVRPGEVTLAHRGVLFLDEFPEFRRDVLEGLRQPLEEKTITVARSQQTLTFPARFQLVAAANPCPCGFKDDPAQACVCTPGALSRYQRKFSGPLLDRMDLFINVPRLSLQEILEEGSGKETSAQVAVRVARARQRQYQRFGSLMTNGEMNIKQVKTFCQLDPASQTFLAKAIEHHHLSMRSYHKLLKVSRTIADLAGSDDIKYEHVAESLQYRKTM